MKIDLVYLWVDSGDVDWLHKKDKYLDNNFKIALDTQSVSECRYIDNNELRYSLRSVEMFAPWINNIYIVTDSQIPNWLNIENPKIHIIDHKDIIDEKYLPLFNSCAIELGIQNIEGLSEHFIYANDDMFFANKISPSFFFDTAGKPIYRLDKLSEQVYNESSDTYHQTIDSVNKLFEGCLEDKYRNVVPNHQIDPYLKSSVKECSEKYSKWYDETLANRFRTPQDMQRHIYALYALKNSNAKCIINDKTSKIKTILNQFLFNSLYVLQLSYFSKKSLLNLDFKFWLRAKLFGMKMVCFNDNEYATNKDRDKARSLMARYFNKKSKFEY